MNRPRSQHYVTRAYLEGFVADGQEMLYVYTRGKDSSFRAKPENLAAINNYYSPKRPDGTYDDRIENAFATQVEGPGIAVIKKLMSGQRQLSRFARGHLAMLLAIQEYRVPWMREEMQKFMQAMLERFSKSMAEAPGLMEATIKKLSLADPGKEAELANQLREGLNTGEIHIAATPEASMHAMGYVLETLPNIYYTMGWEILESKTTPFITSDCPVHRFYEPVQTKAPYRGLMDSRVEVRFPLCKNRMLVLRHDAKRNEMIERLRMRHGKRQAIKVANMASTIKYSKVNASQVDAINAHTASMAALFIFSGVSLANGPDLVSGECRNVRHELVDLPDQVTAFKAIYPT